MIVHVPLEGGLISPVVAGLLLGLIMIGPDHLGTLMALSTLTTGFQALKVGLLWGFGHSIGMILLVPPFMLLEKFSVQAANLTMDQWEYWGDYFIGASMIIVAIYFSVYESKYLEQKDDGTYAARPCSCCHPDCHNPADGECQADTDLDCEEEDGLCCHDSCCSSGAEHSQRTRTDAQETTPLLQDKATSLSWLSTWLAWNPREVRSALLGVFQGLCCPMALMGIGFMGRMSSQEFPQITIFLVVFMAASAIGSGMLTLCWGFLSSNGLVSCVSPLIVYRFVNFFTFALGVIWIVANAAGMLHYVNFMEGMHPAMITGENMPMP